MNLINRRWIRKLPLIAVCLLGVSAGGCGGSSSGGGGDDSESSTFPTPTLPADAVTIDATNATEIASATVEFAGILPMLVEFKTEAAPSAPEVVNLMSEQASNHGRRALSTTSGVTEDLSAAICINGSAIADTEETEDTASGTITYTNCDIGFGILVNGNTSFLASYSEASMDYSFRIGGTLTIQFDTDTVTIVMDIREDGNDGSGDFSNSPSFSLSGLPDGGFLVTSAQPLTGNYFSEVINSGQLIVEGASNTRLRITVVPGNLADVELDNGSGSFVYHTQISIF